MLADRIRLREEPGGVAPRGKDPDDGFDVAGALLLVQRGALGAAVLSVKQ
jgi:hypothetical protein